MANEEQRRPFPMEEIVRSAQAGNKEAQGLLAERLMGTFRPYFRKRFQQEADDLTTTTAMRILDRLDQFTPSLGKGDFAQNFNAWTHRIAQNIHIDERRRERRERWSELDKNKEYGNTNERREPDVSAENLSALLEERILELIPNKCRGVVRLKLQGLSNPTIVQTLHYTYGSVKALLSLARKIAEEKFITPAGYVRANQLENSISHAAGEGRLESVVFLGIRYTTLDAVNRYRKRVDGENSGAPSREVDQKMLDQGFLPLVQTVNFAQYEHIMRYYKELLVMHRGRLYIRSEDLKTLPIKHPQEQRTKNPHVPHGYVLLTTCNTAAEYFRVRKAVKKGDIPVVRSRGRIYVDPQEMAQFLKKP